MGKVTSVFSWTAFIVLLAVFIANKLQVRTQIPEHMLGHEANVVPNLISEPKQRELVKLMKQIKTIPSNANDLKFYTTIHEHIGEEAPLMENGDCPHSYMVPNVNRTACVLAGRIDIARHFMLHGGIVGLKEDFNKAASRVQSFGIFLFNTTKYKVIADLFEEERFLEAAKTVCPADKQYLLAGQFNFISQIPGQTVALHVDGVYFWGASRFQIPQWLLAAMKFSGLWEHLFIDQVQVVSYLHDWTEDRDGEFVYWQTNNEMHSVSPLPRYGTATDGSKTVHAATTYMPDADIPFIDKSKDNAIVYQEDTDKWHLVSDGEKLREYDTDDLRMTIVYRSKCFTDKAEADKWEAHKFEEGLTLAEILATFEDDLIQRGLKTRAELDNMSKLDLGILLMDTYIKYPLPKAEVVVPYNYCMLPKLVPWTKPFLSMLCPAFP